MSEDNSTVLFSNTTIDTASIKGLATVTETSEQVQEREKRKYTPPKVLSIDEAIFELKRLEDGDIISAIYRCLERVQKQGEVAAESLKGVETLAEENARLRAKIANINAALSACACRD